MKLIGIGIIMGLAVAIVSCNGGPNCTSGPKPEIRSGSNDALATTRYGKVAGYFEGGFYIFTGTSEL